MFLGKRNPKKSLTTWLCVLLELLKLDDLRELLTELHVHDAPLWFLAV